MNSDYLYNYFEEYNLNNNTVIFCFLAIFSFIVLINIYCIIKYFYKKCCKKCCKSKRQKYIDQNYDNHQDIDKQFFVITEPFV